MVYILTYYTEINQVSCLNIWTERGREVFFDTLDAAEKKRDELRLADKTMKYIGITDLYRSMRINNEDLNALLAKATEVARQS
jgi:uncharacterized Fe-S cluster-containing protein